MRTRRNHPIGPTISRLSVYAHDEGTEGTGEEVVGVLDGHPVGSINIYPSGAALNQKFSAKTMKFASVPRGRVGYIGGLELPSSARGEGLGSELVRLMLMGAARLGVRSVVLHAEQGGALRFWQRVGFVELPRPKPKNWWETTLPHMIYVMENR